MDFSLAIDDDGRPYVTLDQEADEVRNAVLLSLKIRRGAWFMNPDFGSRLHEINTLSDANVALAARYGAECLEWMKTVRLARSVSVSATQFRGGILLLNTQIIRMDKTEVNYETFFKVV